MHAGTQLLFEPCRICSFFACRDQIAVTNKRRETETPVRLSHALTSCASASTSPLEAKGRIDTSTSLATRQVDDPTFLYTQHAVRVLSCRPTQH